MYTSWSAPPHSHPKLQSWPIWWTIYRCALPRRNPASTYSPKFSRLPFITKCNVESKKPQLCAATNRNLQSALWSHDLVVTESAHPIYDYAYVCRQKRTWFVLHATSARCHLSTFHEHINNSAFCQQWQSATHIVKQTCLWAIYLESVIRPG